MDVIVVLQHSGLSNLHTWLILFLTPDALPKVTLQFYWDQINSPVAGLVSWQRFEPRSLDPATVPPKTVITHVIS